MRTKRMKTYDLYRYRFPLSAEPEKHGELSAVIKRSPDGWHWTVLENGTGSLDHGGKVGLEEAQRDAIHHLNGLLEQSGASTPHLSDSPNDWVGENPLMKFQYQIKKLRSKLTPPWKKSDRRF